MACDREGRGFQAPKAGVARSNRAGRTKNHHDGRPTMTTTEEGHTRPNTSLNQHSLKRRGLFAAAWAVVAAVLLRKGNEPVEATSGSGTDGNFVLGSNDLDNTSNYANHRTQLVPALSFSGTALFESNASPF